MLWMVEEEHTDDGWSPVAMQVAAVRMFALPTMSLVTGSLGLLSFAAICAPGEVLERGRVIAGGVEREDAADVDERELAGLRWCTEGVSHLVKMFVTCELIVCRGCWLRSSISFGLKSMYWLVYDDL